MRFDTIQPTFDGGLDWPVDWLSRCVREANGEVRLHHHIRPDPQACLLALQPCRDDVVVCVECLCTWSGLADLCEDAGLPVVLGHALSRRALHGGTAQNDRSDAPNIAALRRGGLMPQADVYPRRMRATRALVRRRPHLRRTRAAVYAPMQTTASQDNRGEPWGRLATPQNRRRLERVAHRGVQKHRAVDLALLDGAEPRRTALAHDLEQTARGHEPVALARWRTIPGVGNIWALVLRYESEDLARFPRVQACVSSGRLVKSARASTGKRHGPRGQQIGTAPLTWAFAAAAGLLRTHHEPAQPSRATLANSHGTGKALSLLAHTRGRAV